MDFRGGETVSVESAHAAGRPFGWRWPPDSGGPWPPAAPRWGTTPCPPDPPRKAWRSSSGSQRTLLTWHVRGIQRVGAAACGQGGPARFSPQPLSSAWSCRTAKLLPLKSERQGEIEGAAPPNQLIQRLGVGARRHAEGRAFQRPITGRYSTLSPGNEMLRDSIRMCVG